MKRRPRQNPIGTKDRPSEAENRFIEAYTKEGDPTYLNATKSYQKAYNASYGVANAAGHTLLKRPRIQKSMKEMLAETDIADTVRDGLNKIARGFLFEDKYRPRDFTEAARLITEIRGDKSPEKQIIMNLTPEDRAAEYEEITNRVLKVQAKKKPEEEVQTDAVQPT